MELIRQPAKVTRQLHWRIGRSHRPTAKYYILGLAWRLLRRVISTGEEINLADTIRPLNLLQAGIHYRLILALLPRKELFRMMLAIPLDGIRLMTLNNKLPNVIGIRLRKD